MKTTITEYQNEKMAAAFYDLLVRQEVSRTLNPRKKISHTEAHHIRNAILMMGIGLLLALALFTGLFAVSVLLFK